MANTNLSALGYVQLVPDVNAELDVEAGWACAHARVQQRPD
jgi:hypothetical protein